MTDRRTLAWIWHRILYLIPVAILATFFVFGLLYLVPGDPAITLAGEKMRPSGFISKTR